LRDAITSNDVDFEAGVLKDVSSIDTIIIYYCSSREGHCTNNKKRAMKRILGRPNNNQTIEKEQKKNEMSPASSSSPEVLPSALPLPHLFLQPSFLLAC
jgi:hypothetical protein